MRLFEGRSDDATRAIVIARREALRRSRAADPALHPWIASLALAITMVVRPNRILC
jgi:hypothetical protein